jgi:hypothetical protein
MSEPLNFFLGRYYDPATGKTLPETVSYDPANLTTHAVITGMTGSGKTGLGIAILEEAALQGIPAIIVDPKGDLTNLLLHFPDLAPGDFQPWLDPDLARRQGKSLPDLAQITAEQWKTGLEGWGLGRPQLQALQQAVEFTIFTPGSTAGKPVNILSSFKAPEINWSDNSELLREKIASTVTALLGLVGMTDIDPLRSREHILIANLMETAWSQGQSLDLTAIIQQVQKPPFDRLGAFPLEGFFPEKDRLPLAMLLNNFLASPSFQSWQTGEPLDVPALLYAADGRPRHSIFYLAHLDEPERMFFVTLLFAAVESWMRTQRGTSGLRALVYFDEILGYLPPVANPSSRPLLLRMLKQARAFGVGMVLATQNPVDLDYKALSNAGTWMIGRLQTDRDKLRLLDGLESAGDAVDRAALDRQISGLQKRVFILHNVNSPDTRLFQSRWTLNFLAGPLTRAQIPDLNRLASAASTAAVNPAGAQPAAVTVAPLQNNSPTTAPAQPVLSIPPVMTASVASSVPVYSTTRPAVPDGLVEYFVPGELGVGEALKTANQGIPPNPQAEGLLYCPALLTQVEVRYLVQRYNLNYSLKHSVMVTDLSGSMLQWEDYAWNVFLPGKLQSQPQPQARFTTLPGWLTDVRKMSALQKGFLDWVYRNGTIHIHANPTLNVFAGPQITTAEFHELCSQAARAALKAEQDKATAAYQGKLTLLTQKIERQKLVVQEQEDIASRRKGETLVAGGEVLLGLFTKRKRSLNTTLSKNRMAEKAKSDLGEDRQLLADLQTQLASLEQARDSANQQVQDKWGQSVNDEAEVPVPLAKKDIFLEYFGIAWLPYYLVRQDGQLNKIAAFTAPQR